VAGDDDDQVVEGDHLMHQIAPDQLVRADFAAIPRYGSGPECEIELGDNTNQWGMPPAAAAALGERTPVSGYPDMYANSLKRTVAALAGVGAECVVTGNGSDDIIDCAIRAFAAPGERIAHPDPTFVMVPIFARINSVVPVPVPLSANGEMDADALLATKARIIYLCTPNNPTATATPYDAIRRVIAHAPGLVIVDEAYVEFAGVAGLLSEAPALERVLVCRTMSKAYGLAGLRVGYATASPQIVENVEKSRGPFKVNAVGERVAVAALTKDRAWVTARVKEAVQNRDRLAAELRSLALDPLPSAANFLLVRTPKALEITAHLRSRSIGVRAFVNLPVVGTAFRITAGPWPMMERAVAAIKEALA
jgi:histidinol-phosphate aminotransferase